MRNCVIAKRILLIALLATVAASAQQPAASPSPQQPSIRTESNLVLIPTLVRDAGTHAVLGLKASDFVVEDDGVPQTIRLDEAADPQPVSMVLAIQTGRTAAAEFPRIRTLASMLNPLLEAGQLKLAIVEFDSQVNLIQDFTTQSYIVEHRLKNMKAGDDGASILDAVNLSVDLLSKVPKDRQRVLLLISETRDHGSQAPLDGVISSVALNNTLIYSLAFSPSLSNVLDDARGNSVQEGQELNVALLAQRLMIMSVQAMRKNVPKTIAEMTGGEYELFKSHKGFESRMVEFSNHLYSRYLLSFEPKDPHPGLHSIRVRLADPARGSAIARTTYWVGPQPVE